MTALPQQRPAPTTTCIAVRKDGRPCTAAAWRDGLCIGHHPDAAEARRRGGYARASGRRLLKAAPQELRSLVELLLRAIAEVHDGQLDPRAATALAALARAAAAIYETAELSARVDALERVIGERGRWP